MAHRKHSSKTQPADEASLDDSTESIVEIRVFTSSNSGLSRYGLWEIDRMLNDPETSLPRCNFRIIELPADRNQELMETMNIYALPTTVVGNQQIIGIPDERTLQLALNEYLTR
ncbi:MAG: hypothetical protein ACFFED_15520 [Candidatus Thorarchaeota archaeon]